MKVVCPFCGVGCNLKLENNRVRVLENPEVNGKRACIKGINFHHLLRSPERLKTPMVREGDEFVEVSWKEALSLIAEKLTEFTPKIGFLCSGKILNEEAYLLQKLCRALGTNNIDTCARLCHAASEVALTKMLGYGATTICWEDIDLAETILCVGENVKFSHPVVWSRIRGRENANLIVADAGKIVDYADIAISPKPGTDLIWLCGVAKVLIDRGWYDREFVESRCVGFRSFVSSISWCSPDVVEKVSGVQWRKIEEIAEMIRNKTVFVWGMGLTQHPYGTRSVMAVTSLALLTGNVGKPGCGLAPLRGQNNVQGVGDMGAHPAQLPGHYSVLDPVIRDHFESYWGFRIPDVPGITATQMIHSIAEEKINALYIVGENPVLSEPQSDVVKWMLSSLKFLIVQDIFMTETAKLADVVLPAAMIGEKEGTCTNATRRIQITEKVENPPGNAMEDWKIVQGIARELGLGWAYRCAEDVWNEVRECVPMFRGATYDALRKSSGLQWPVFRESTRRLYEKNFAFPDGRARFHEINRPEFIIHPVKDYPFVLVTCRLYEHFNTGEMTMRIERLRKFSEFCVYMNEEDAEKVGVKDGSKVMVYSPYGSVITKVRIGMKGIKINKGVITAPIHFFKECNFNRLMSAFPLDPDSKTPPLKTIPVNIVPL